MNKTVFIYGKLPNASQVFYYGECLRAFSEIPIDDGAAEAVAYKKIPCKFSLYSLGYDYKTPVIGMIVAGGQRKQLVPIFHGGAGIIDRRFFDPSDILFKNLLGSQIVI